jgi:HSP20 family protein
MLRYDPWKLFNQMQREMARSFEPRNAASGEPESAGDWSPAVDIKDEPERYIILADVPGVDPKDIEINTENGILTITGTRAHPKAEERERYQRRERATGTFVRRFALPDRVDSERISARGRNGVLEISIPKSAGVQPRRISVEH